MTFTRIFDKYGRLIENNDILKVFHFIGARNKKHYMYKMALQDADGFIWGSHLESTKLGFDVALYLQIRHDDIEIVASSRNPDKLLVNPGAK